MPRPDPPRRARAATGETRIAGGAAGIGERRLDAARSLGSLWDMPSDMFGSERSRPSLASRGAMLTALALLPVALTLTGCAISVEQRAATERAWAEHDREWAADCARRGGRYISSSCVGWGGP
jgi:hypothetical protein